MAKLPPIDLQVHWIRDLLHRGKREEALARLEEVLATGRAGKETLELAEYLRTAKRGRQPFGAQHLYYDIGIDNDELRDAGRSYVDRIAELGVKYMLAPRQIETAIAKYETVMDEIRSQEPC